VGISRPSTEVKKCVVNCGVVERALCGGLQGGLYCLWKAIDMVLFGISFGADNLNTCMLNEVNFGVLIVN
jgi:hypothetical protein